MAPGANLRAYQVLVLVLVFAGWYVLTSPTLLPPIYFDDANKAAFFFGYLTKAAGSGRGSLREIYRHLWVTLIETFLAFAIGTALGIGIGIWLALAGLRQFTTHLAMGLNAMPRVILAPIFFVWFGLGTASKVALGVTLVFFIVFFNVYQGAPVRWWCSRAAARQPCARPADDA